MDSNYPILAPLSLHFRVRPTPVYVGRRLDQAQLQAFVQRGAIYPANSSAWGRSLDEATVGEPAFSHSQTFRACHSKYTQEQVNGG